MIFNQRQLICTAGHVGCLPGFTSTTAVSRGLEGGRRKDSEEIKKRVFALKVGPFGLGQLAESRLCSA